MALIKCSECGNMVSDKAEACVHCGAPVATKTKCKECGQLISNNLNSCPNCGAPIETATNSKTITAPSKLKILWMGKYAMAKCSIKVFVNNEYIGEYSYNDGFSIEVPITSSEMYVEVLCNSIKNKFKFQLSTNVDYTCTLMLSSGLSGMVGFSYKLSDSYGNISKDTDKLGAGMTFLCFLIPIVGIIYYFAQRAEYPSKSKTALYCGLIAWAAYTFIFLTKLF